jgi:hypothetical protein
LSVEALKWAFEQEDVPPGPRFVLVALANRANEEGGDCYPSVKWIQRKTGFSDSTIRGHLDDLEGQYRKLSKKERRREDGGKSSNEYQLHLLAPPTPEIRRGVPPTPGGGHLQNPAGAPPESGGHETKEHTKETKSAPVSENPQPIAKGNEGRKPRSSPPPNPLPGEVPDDVWAGFVELRARKRAPLTALAVKLLVGKVREIGQPAKALLEQAIERGWTTVFPLKGERLSGAAEANEDGNWRRNYL